jgi:predicted metal-binding protein
MLFGSPEEVLKVPTEAMFNSPSNVVDMFERMQIQGRESSTQIGEALTAAGHDYMQIANCLIICRPKTTVEAKQWISDNLDGAASTHIAGQKVPSNWQTGVEYVLGVPEQQFTLGEIVVLNRSDGSVKFGLLQQLRVMPNTHLVLVECEADFQGRGAQAGKAVAIEDIGKLKIDDDQIPPV